MYACICHAVTEQQVRACAGQRLGEVVSATRAGSGCGSCVRRIRSLIEQPAAPDGQRSADRAA